jgi:hypothetical protein
MNEEAILKSNDSYDSWCLNHLLVQWGATESRGLAQTERWYSADWVKAKFCRPSCSCDYHFRLQTLPCFSFSQAESIPRSKFQIARSIIPRSEIPSSETTTAASSR